MVKKTVEYNDKILKDFFKFHFKKLSILIFVCGLLLVACGVVYICIASVVSGIITVVVGVFFACYPWLLVAISLSQNRRLLDTIEYFEFGEDELKVVGERFGEEVSNSSTKYSNLETIKSNKDYVFLYINKSSAIPLKKSDLTKEEYDFIVGNVSKHLLHKK